MNCVNCDRPLVGIYPARFVQVPHGMSLVRAEKERVLYSFCAVSCILAFWTRVLEQEPSLHPPRPPLPSDDDDGMATTRDGRAVEVLQEPPTKPIFRRDCCNDGKYGGK